LTSALNKVPDGAWFTISLAVAISTVFSTWRFGKERQWSAERLGRLSKLGKLVTHEKGDITVLTEEFGGGEVTHLKGSLIFLSRTQTDRDRPRAVF
jgi:KUP system potassium uptake protein